MTRETWYILEDGSFGDPREISPGADGRLRHKDGRLVAEGPHGPKSSGVDVEAVRASGKRRDMAPEPAPETPTTEMKPAAGKRYQTRKAD